MNDKPQKRTKCDGEKISADSIVRADLEARMICIFGEITPAVHLAMIDCLNRLSESDTDVTVYINSQGGNLTSALAIYDMFTSGRYPKAEVRFPPWLLM